MISLIVLTVSSVFNLSKNQLKAMRHIRLTKSSVKTIELAYKFYKTKKKYYDTKVKISPEIEQTSEFLLLTRNNHAKDNDIISMHENLISVKTKISNSNLRGVEKQLMNELNVAFLDLQIQIEDFKVEKFDMRNLVDKKEQEILMNNRFIKSEVQDITLQIEDIQDIIQEKNDQILQLLQVIVQDKHCQHQGFNIGATQDPFSMPQTVVPTNEYPSVTTTIQNSKTETNAYLGQDVKNTSIQDISDDVVVPSPNFKNDLTRTEVVSPESENNLELQNKLEQEQLRRNTQNNGVFNINKTVSQSGFSNVISQ